ncbi:8626_t:CDS:1 [Gigaspora rosea]|nr:8626_t:CDS:1 [Gigaspora rosea]
MGDIPFNCPSDYPYTSSTILAGCKVREVNLICMWLYFATLIIIIPLFWSWRNASESSPSLDDSERGTGGFFSFVDKLGLLSILRRQPPRPEDEPKIKPEVLFEYKVGTAESPTEI